MASATTKHEIIKRIAAETKQPRNVVRQITQAFLDNIVDELARGKRLEFRDFGVFEVVTRKPRVARNPRTGDPIHVPAKTVVHFKQGRVMKTRVAEYGERLGRGQGDGDEGTGRETPAQTARKTAEENTSGQAGFLSNSRNVEGSPSDPDSGLSSRPTNSGASSPPPSTL